MGVVNDTEILILLVSTTTLALSLALLRRLRFVPAWRLLLASFLTYFGATFFSVAEGVLLPDLFNLLEHLSRVIFPLLVVLWAVRARREAGERDAP